MTRPNFDPSALLDLVEDLATRIAKFEKFVPLLEKLYAGEIAGEGATQESGIQATPEEFAATDPAQQV